MNKQTALIAFLWKHNIPFIKHYLQHNPRTVFLLADFADAETARLLETTGSTVKLLHLSISPPVAEEAKQATRLAADVLRQHGVAGELSAVVEEKSAIKVYEDTFAQHLPSVFSLLNELQQIANEYFIEAVLLNEESLWLGKTTASWAKQQGIPAIHLSHGTGILKNYNFESYRCDTIAVFSDRSAEYYLDNAVSRERIEVIGHPAWSRIGDLRQQRAVVRQALCSRANLDPALPVVMFGTTWNAYLSTLDDRDLETELRDFLSIYPVLQEQGLRPQMVIKDRLSAGQDCRQRVFEIAGKLGIPGNRIAYDLADAQSWVAAADVVVSIDSNLAIEALLAETPAINLITPFGMLAGAGFAHDDAILHCEPEGLADAVLQVLTSAALRNDLQQKMRRNAERFDKGVDGKAEARFSELIEKKRRVNPDGAGQYVWQTLLEVDEADSTQYHNWPRSELVDIAPRAPRRVLDIGCAAGKTGEYIKQKFPQAKIYGVEINSAAAALAAKRLDSVFAGKFEDFDFAAHGITPGSLDTVIVADVLEHIYDPWGVLVRIKPYLTSDAQILASIPNTRNLALMSGLAEGDWRYEAWGLLDVTHIRFFTLKEIRRFFHETGYRVALVRNNLDPRLAGLYQEHRGNPLMNIDFDKFTMKNVSPDELVELCTIQFLVVGEPGAVGNEVFAAQEKALAVSGEAQTAYDLWSNARRLTKAQGDLYEQRMATWAGRPLFHLVVVANPFDEARIGATIQSLASQYYHDLHLTIITPALPPANWADNNQLTWRQADEAQLLASANQTLLDSRADWLGMINAGDAVAAHSLLFFAEAIHAHPEWSLIYSDEDALTGEGKHDAPQLKPDFNLDLLRSTHYTGGLALYSGALFKRLGGFTVDVQGAEDYDLVLRVFEAAGAKAIGHLPDVLYHRLQDGDRWHLQASNLLETGRCMVEAHLRRTGIQGAVEHGLFPASYRVRYEHAAKPRVSILLAVRDRLEAVQRCIESILGSTHYPDYEILILDNDSTMPETKAYLAGLEAMDDERIRVYTYRESASLPRLHNLLAQEARGDYLLFLHFDAAILQEDWLDGLMAHALRPEVGLVAPRLLRADGKVAQTGLILGMDAAAGSPFQGEALDQAGYFGRAHIEQNFSALGGGCLLVRGSLFEELGGFDAEHFPGDFSEADFSIRAGRRGWLAVWTPFVNILCGGEAMHHAWRGLPVDDDAIAATRKAAREHLYQRYLPLLARDPAYNVNLGLGQEENFAMENNPTITWDPLPWRPLPRVLAHAADSQGCGEYRILSPMRALAEAGKVQGWSDFTIFSPPEMARVDVDSIIFQRQTTPEQIEAIARHKQFSRALRVYELDDLLIKLPVKSIHKTHMPKDIARLLRRGIALCDRFIVATEPLKEAYKDYHADIRVVPNFLERARWGGFKPLRRQSERPRVGWAGGVGHTGDLEMIANVVQALADRVDWVFMGLCPDGLRPFVKEFHPGVPIGQYPARLAGLNLDLAVAPLEYNAFNEAKSHLRLLEYGVLGYPVICSDVYPYRGDFPVVRARNKYKEWVDAILAQVADLDRCASQGDALRDHVNEHWMLEDNLDQWMRAWLP